ncbi:MAG: site-specific DNA-methyltransferase (adenine-specific) [Candidatus Kapaibacterium sp.]|nr:MAG: site-specific DNA-methyltransferase (adenine-specific) [Candidatus Kapabacteria bacterium]
MNLKIGCDYTSVCMMNRITVHKSYPRPFLKWAGGKTQIAEQIIRHRPSNFRAYHEPFVGSGAVFFALFRLGLVRRATLSDTNWELMETYHAIRDCPQEVMKILAEFPYSRDFYYALREKDPRELTLAERAARMIYLNKTGYNGLYRVNRQGKFNVPFGRYQNPSYYDPENLHAVSIALANVELRCESFENVKMHAAEQDWVYFDPPYVPLSATANFTSYQPGGFHLSDQQRLRDLYIELTNRGVYATLSNSDTPVVHNLYHCSKFRIIHLHARRAISCNASKRESITELIVLNYPSHLEPESQHFDRREALVPLLSPE